jgi:hypothetical protein
MWSLGPAICTQPKDYFAGYIAYIESTYGSLPLMALVAILRSYNGDIPVIVDRGRVAVLNKCQFSHYSFTASSMCKYATVLSTGIVLLNVEAGSFRVVQVTFVLRRLNAYMPLGVELI